MALEEEEIPSLETPVGENLVLSWDVTPLEAQLGSTVVSIAWSAENPTVMSVNSIGNNGKVFFAAVSALTTGCSHLIANVTLEDGNQTPTFLFMQIFVIDPKCSSLC